MRSHIAVASDDDFLSPNTIIAVFVVQLGPSDAAREVGAMGVKVIPKTVVCRVVVGRYHSDRFWVTVPWVHVTSGMYR